MTTQEKLSKVREVLKSAFDFVERYGDSRKDAHYIEQFGQAISIIDSIQPKGVKLDIHIVLDALAQAAKGKPLDPETCQVVQDIAKEYKYSDFSESDIQALYDCGSMRPTPRHSDD